MNAIHSKSAFLYEQVRQALRSGHYLPGQRIDPATLASEFHTSPTPVRFALYRLVGEGLLEDHARGGLHVPLPTEVALRDLYDWMLRLLLMACGIGTAPSLRRAANPEPTSTEADVMEATWQLFDAITRVTAHLSLYRAVRQANDRLAPIRRIEPGLIEQVSEEFAGLDRHWRQRDMPALEAALRDYHERRKQLVPCIVAVLSGGADYLH